MRHLIFSWHSVDIQLMLICYIIFVIKKIICKEKKDMILNFYPWTIDITDEVKYLEDSISFESNVNNTEKFKSVLTNEQIGFFEKLGIDINNLTVDYHLFNSTEIFETRFLLKGKFISMPSSQINTYLDIEFFHDSILKNIKTTDVSEEDMAKNHIENMQFSFKHPIIYSDKEIYKQWDCGYICGVVIIKHPISTN